MKEPSDNIKKLKEIIKKWEEYCKKFDANFDEFLLVEFGLDTRGQLDMRMFTEERKNLKKCKYCQGIFTRKSRDHRSEFCSGLCRKKYIAYQRNKNKGLEYLPPKEIKNCVVCGASLDGKRLGTKTCSLNCRVKLHLQKKKE